MKIVFDCDNTFGVDGCDIDDGLALIYLLGIENVDILGITTTFGNSLIDVTYPNTQYLLREIHRTDIPVYKGSAMEGQGNEAAEFLVKMANQHKGELSILATGSLTNLYQAWRIDPLFYEKIKNISLMGGAIEPLFINGKQLNELNFSVDAEAAYHVLTYGKSLTIATGNCCLDCFFDRVEFDEKLGGDDNVSRWLHHKSIYWFDREKDIFNHAGIYKWDVIAAATLVAPEFFSTKLTQISPSRKSLDAGFLIADGVPVIVSLPSINDTKAFKAHVYEAYLKSKILIKEPFYENG